MIYGSHGYVSGPLLDNWDEYGLSSENFYRLPQREWNKMARKKEIFRRTARFASLLLSFYDKKHTCRLQLGKELKISSNHSMDPSIPQNLDEYSASSTTIKFDHPIPLLRGPIPAFPPGESPSSGTHVLAFRSAESWATAYQTCKSKIISQCEEGARLGCAITASNKCKPPWWRNFFGGGVKLEELKERERCEDREMEGCLVVAKEKCIEFANEKCLKSFKDARIAVREDEVVRNLVCMVSLPESSKWVSLIGFGKFDFGVTNRRASDLLGSNAKYQWFFK